MARPYRVVSCHFSSLHPLSPATEPFSQIIYQTSIADSDTADTAELPQRPSTPSTSPLRPAADVQGSYCYRQPAIQRPLPTAIRPLPFFFDFLWTRAAPYPPTPCPARPAQRITIGRCQASQDPVPW
jgi:hypothetical protein